MHVGCQEVPLPLAVPLYAVAVPVGLVRGDFTHEGKTFDVTDLVGVDREKTKALAKEVVASRVESGGELRSGSGRLWWSQSTANADAAVERWLATRRATRLR